MKSIKWTWRCLFSSMFLTEMAVALQFRVLQSAIEFIKTTSNQEPQKLSSSVNAPSSPHHAIYQKRKSIAGELNRCCSWTVIIELVVCFQAFNFHSLFTDHFIMISRFHCHERLHYPSPPQTALLLLWPDPHAPSLQLPVPGLPPPLPYWNSILHAPLWHR